MVEVIIYLAIVSLLLTAAISLQLTLGGTSVKSAVKEDVAQNRRSAMSTVEYLIKNSDGLLRDVFGTCSDLASSTPLLALYFNNDSYLPGTCVSNGGGVELTVDNDTNRLKLTCHPNITNNGQYQACSTVASNTYYLTSPTVSVYKDSWKLSTSTATSSNDGFSAVTATLSVGAVSGGQVSLAATSTATSTVVMRNEHPYGLISWWRFDDNTIPTTSDTITGQKQTCYWPDYVAGLVDGSTGAFDFITANSDYCFYSNSGGSSAWNDIYALDGPFTISAWIKTHWAGDGYQEKYFISQVSPTTYGYYYEILKSSAGCVGRSWVGVFDTDTGYANLAITPCNTMADNTVYNLTFVFDPSKNTATQYIYKKGIGGVSTTTTTNIPTAVHYQVNAGFRIGNGFDGVVDEVRIYNRVLSNSEIWAIQSQGAN